MDAQNRSYSVAQLKRDAKAGNLRAVMTVWLGQEVDRDKLPARLQGARKIVDANTTSLMFEVPDDPTKKSHLDLPKASLVEYTDEYLRIYSAGYREPNAAEQRVLDEWSVIQSTERYQMQAEVDALLDGSSTYWEMVSFFQKHDMKYLMGFEKQRGLVLDFNKRNAGDKAFIQDENIRGEISMEYRFERERTNEKAVAGKNPSLSSRIESAESRREKKDHANDGHGRNDSQSR